MRSFTHRGSVVCALVIGFSVCTSAAHARTATPATLDDALADVRSGETLTLTAGNYGEVTLPRRSFGQSVIIDATRAIFTQVMIRNIRGIEWRGGAVTGPVTQAFGVAVDQASNIRISGVTVSGPRIGLTISRSTGVRVDGNVFDGVRSDGVNVTMASNVIIQNNVCRNFRPVMPIYASDGTLITDGDHPDCIQGWGTAGQQPTTDITVTNNVGTGYMQGIFFRSPWGGRMKRLVVRGNTMTVSAYNAIVLQDVDGATVTQNVVRSVTGSRALNYPFSRIRAWIRLRGTGLKACDNQAPDDPERYGTRRC